MPDDIHTTSVSRRNAIKGGAAVAVAATVPSVAVADDAELLKLEADWRRTQAAWRATDELADEAGHDAAWDKWREVEERICAAPAETPVGMAVKLRIWAFWRKGEAINSDEYLVTSCLADAERLAGGAA